MEKKYRFVIEDLTLMDIEVDEEDSLTAQDLDNMYNELYELMETGEIQKIFDVCVGEGKRMNAYRVNYIDGYDLRYKSFETMAQSKKEAVSNLWATYKDNGDFDHQIIEILRLEEPVDGGLRIGEADLVPPPFIRERL